MAGRKPREAVKNYVGPLQRVLSCVSTAVLLHRPPDPRVVQAWTTSEDPVRVRCGDGSLWLSVGQEYQVVRYGGPLGPWKVSTKRYRYRVDDDAGTELVSWHWHPASGYRHPHAHVMSGHLVGQHLPTGRVSLEAVVRFLIEEMGATPRRDDWDRVLTAAEEAS